MERAVTKNSDLNVQLDSRVQEMRDEATREAHVVLAQEVRLSPAELEIRRSACLYRVLPVTEARLSLPQARSDQSWGNTIVTWNISD